MKRLTLLLLVLLAWQMASAQIVTAEQARQRAARFFTKAEVRTKSASVSPDEFKLIGTFPEVTTKSPAATPVMYIFERAAGGYAYTDALSCRISKPIEEGDQIVLAMRSTLTGEWIPLTHERKSSVVFTKRPLTELTEIGYAEEPAFWDEEISKRDIYFLVNRDVSWLLYDEVGNELFGGQNWSNSKVIRNGSVIRWVYDVADSEDPRCDRSLLEIDIPTGTYTIRLKNPATGEEMELKLVV